MGTNSSTAEAVKSGWVITGELSPDVWRLICKATNHDTGEYHSTKGMELSDGTWLIQCDSRQADGTFTRNQTHTSAKPRFMIQRET